MTRVVTYDVRSGHDYTDFYEFVEKHNGAQLTESTYAINTSYNLKQFEAQLKLLFRRGDSIYIISVDSDSHCLFHKKLQFK